MIISEKQIMSLIRLLDKVISNELGGNREGAIALLDQIYNQQSEELKEIE